MSLPSVEIPLGAMRFNSDSSKLEYWNGSAWFQIHTFSPNLDGGARGVFHSGRTASASDKNNIDYPFLSDFNRRVVTEYDVTFNNLAGLEGYVSANRAIVVVDPDGVFKYKWIAPNPGVEPDYDEIRTAVK